MAFSPLTATRKPLLIVLLWISPALAMLVTSVPLDERILVRRDSMNRAHVQCSTTPVKLEHSTPMARLVHKVDAVHCSQGPPVAIKAPIKAPIALARLLIRSCRACIMGPQKRPLLSLQGTIAGVPSYRITRDGERQELDEVVTHRMLLNAHEASRGHRWVLVPCSPRTKPTYGRSDSELIEDFFDL